MIGEISQLLTVLTALTGHYGSVPAPTWAASIPFNSCFRGSDIISLPLLAGSTHEAQIYTDRKTFAHIKSNLEIYSAK